jgi:aspartate racemase
MSKTIGVIGGMGPLATQAFMRAVVRETAAATDQEHLHVLVDSDPSIPDRTAFILGLGPDPRPAILAAGSRLKAAGAELFVMPCNTANVWVDEFQEALDRPFVDWIDVTIDAVPSASVVGLLATSGTLAAGHYQTRLRVAGHRTLVPDSGGQDRVMAAIYGAGGVKAVGTARDVERTGLEQAARDLVRRGAGVLILACTELPFAIDPSSIPSALFIDPSIAVARTLVEQAGGSVRGLGSAPEGC